MRFVLVALTLCLGACNREQASFAIAHFGNLEPARFAALDRVTAAAEPVTLIKRSWQAVTGAACAKRDRPWYS